MKKFIIYMVLALIGATAPIMAQSNEDDYDESIRMPIRRLHPEREREKARKKLQQQIDAKNKVERQDDEQQWDNHPKGKAKDGRKVVGTARQQTSTADKTLLNELLGRDYSLKQYVMPQPEPLRWKDDPVKETQNELLMQVDKQPVRAGVTHYLPKGISMANTANEFFAHFTVDGATAGPIKLRVQYYADDPLNFNDIQFIIDGFEYAYRAHSPRRGKGQGRMIWENSDQDITSPEKDLIYALSHAHWVRMALVGSDGTKHVKMLTEKQIRDFYCILQLYRIMGGTI